MSAAVDGPWSRGGDATRPNMFTIRGHGPERHLPDDSRAGRPERDLHARDSGRVYQAARDQYIVDRQPPAPGAVRNTLPRDTVDFTGRDEELRELIGSVKESVERDTVIPVHAIDGMPGVGKSAFAIHAGHQLAPYFPGGQFFVDLHTHSLDQSEIHPAEALFILLSLDGVDPAYIPPEPQARAALWRGRLAGRRVLFIIDDAPGWGHVEQLLPGAPGALVLVTSRGRLTGLSARHGARNISLRTLPQEEAKQLFSRMAGRSPGVEDEAVTELVRLCGHLPLAICLLAARLRPEPRWRIADLVEELKQATHRLAHMRAENVAVAAAFDLSCRKLPAGRRRFFRRLGLHPGTELDAHAAAALTGVPPERARRELDALYQDHLLDQPGWGRYRMHALIAEYARSQSRAEPARDREQAVTRLLDHYLHALGTGGGRLSRPGERAPGTPAATPAHPPAPEWFATERGNLLSCAVLLSAGSDPARTVAFATAMAGYLRDNGPWEHAMSLHRAASAAARQLGDRAASADALIELGLIQRAASSYPAAENTLRDALRIFRDLGDDGGIARALTHLAGVRWRAGDPRAAAHELGEALARYDELGDGQGQADALHELGVVRHQTKDRPGAVEAFHRALTLYQELGDSRGEADTFNRLGLARQLTGEYQEAIEAHERALTRYRELAHRFGQARALNGLGLARCQIGAYEAAEQALVEALSIHDDLGYRRGHAIALYYLGVVRRCRGDHQNAEQVLRQALTCYREIGDQLGQADVLNQLGILARLRGDLRTAEATLEQSLAMFRDLDNELGQAEAHNSFGELSLARGEPEQALAQHRKALQLARTANNVMEETHSVAGIGRSLLELGQRTAAVNHLRRAEANYRRVGALHAAQALTVLAEGIAPPRAPIQASRAA